MFKADGVTDGTKDTGGHLEEVHGLFISFCNVGTVEDPDRSSEG